MSETSDVTSSAPIELSQSEKLRIKRMVFKSLRGQGFELQKGEIVNPPNDKARLRELHLEARRDKASRELKAIGKREAKLLNFIATPEDIDVKNIDPEVVRVESKSEDNWLFRYATLLWSVPVTSGYGRRTRFLVKDKSNGKLIGAFAAADPVFNLACRDKEIGWTGDDRTSRLYNVFDLFVLGAVPPYNRILGGKLVAMLAASNETRSLLEEKYRGSETVIEGKVKPPEVALMTTSSALGSSSLYARIKGCDLKALYRPVGKTEGWGHFHLNHGLFERMVDVVKTHDSEFGKKHRYNQGPNWKLRTARQVLRLADMSPRIMKHGISRQVFMIDVAHNAGEFLRGEHDAFQPRDLPAAKQFDYWRNRWLAGRLERGFAPEGPDRLGIARAIRAGLPIPLPTLLSGFEDPE